MEARGKTFILCGSFVHATEKDALVAMENHCLGVKDGQVTNALYSADPGQTASYSLSDQDPHFSIVFLDPASELSSRLLEHQLTVDDVVTLDDGQFVLPGFIDTHIHAPQYPNAGKGLDRGLLEWLEKYTFPTEAKFADLKFAAMAYKKAVRRVLMNGTTTACYFATIDTDASLVLCDVIDELGQRGLVGKVNMDQNSPDYYVEPSVEHSINETKRFVEAVFRRDYQHITPVITPRFAISCCGELMKQLGHLAKSYDIPIQTHICETPDEVAFVSTLYPDRAHYTDVYDHAGLLTNKTVLAHGIYLTQDEISVIRDRGSSVSHCPNSNLSIRSGLCDVQNLLRQNVKVGLGTDLSGGYHPSMLDAIRTAVHVSNTHAITKDVYTAISVREAFRLATLGGAKALALDRTIGNFEVGKQFDALVIDPCAPDTVMDVFSGEHLTDTVDKFLYTGDDRNIVSIFVSGKCVHSKGS